MNALFLLTKQVRVARELWATHPNASCGGSSEDLLPLRSTESEQRELSVGYRKVAPKAKTPQVRVLSPRPKKEFLLFYRRNSFFPAIRQRLHNFYQYDKIKSYVT